MDNELNNVISSVLNLLDRRNDGQERIARYREAGRTDELQGLREELNNADAELRNLFKNNGTMQEVIDQLPEFRRLATEKIRVERSISTESNETVKNSLNSQLNSINQRLSDMLNVRDITRDNNEPNQVNPVQNRAWGPLTPEEIDDAIQLGFTEYTPGDGADFDRFLVDHGYNPEKLKAEKDAETRDSNTNKGWEPLTPEEIDDAIQLGFTEYTPGDGADFDRFLIDHGYNPEKLKNQLDKKEPKNTPDKNTPTATKEKEPVEVGEGTIGEGLSLESELRRIFSDNGIAVSDDDIKNLAKNNKAEINGQEYQVDYSGADGYDYTDEPATPFKLVVMKDKKQEKKPEGPVAGATAGAKDPVTPNPVGGAAAGIKDPVTPDPVGGAAGTKDPVTPNPVGGAAARTKDPVTPEPVTPTAIHATATPTVVDLKSKGVKSEIRYNGDSYILSRSVDGKVENEATFTFFEKAEIRSNRKRIAIMKNDKEIAALLKAHPEIKKKQLKKADPTILKGLAIDKKYYGIALSYIQQLGKGKNADKGKLKDDELGNVSINYDVPVDDAKFGYMKKIAKYHKNIAEVKIPTLGDRIKNFFGIGQNVFGKAEEKKILGPAKNEVKAKFENATEQQKNIEMNVKDPSYTNSWDLKQYKDAKTNKPISKEDVNKKTAERWKRDVERRKEKKEAFILAGLKQDSKDYIADLRKIDPKAAEEYQNLPTDQARIEYRKQELNRRYLEGKNKGQENQNRDK